MSKMNIFYETIKKFNDFKSRINIKIDQFMPGYSMNENIINSYNKVLDEKSKLENKNYIEINKNLELIKQEIKDRGNITKQIEPLVVNFQEAYKKKYGEIELQSISQKAFIRIKKEELKKYLTNYEIKLKEKEELESKKADISSEVTLLKNKIGDRCRKYMEDVNVKNVEDLKSDINGISTELIEIPVEKLEVNSDYMKSEEYLNSISEYKEAYGKLYSFMSDISEAIQRFVDNSKIENVLPDLLMIQNEIREKYNDYDKLDNEENKINDFLGFKENYEEALSAAEKELENINGLVNEDEELLAIKAEIESYISQSNIA